SAKCTGSFQHCTADASDKCETNTDLDVAHCGACATPCSTTHGTPACNAAKCSIACDAGFADCNNDASDGCEVDVTRDGANCGACGSACSHTNATEACSGGRCTITACAAGANDCDH